MKNNIIKFFKKIPVQLLGVFGAIFVILLPFENNLVAYGHDASFHITNYLSNKNFIDISNLSLLIPKVFSGEIANGFGYGTGVFYPPLSYYLTTYCSHFLEIINIDPIISITVIEILILVFSGIVMFLFLNDVFDNKNVAALGAISYVTSTYLLCDLYVRAALAELLTFLFIPLVFWALYDLFFRNGKKFRMLFIIGYVGMILSHLVVSVYLTLIILLIFILNLKKVFRKEKIKELIISSIIILLLTSPFTVPLVEHKLFGNYVVFGNNTMYSIEQLTKESLKIDDFFKVGVFNNGIKVFVNQIVLILFIVVIVFNKKIFKDKDRNIFYLALGIILLSGYVASVYFPWDKASSLMKMIQFPWRMLIFVNFGLAVLVGNSVKLIRCENKKVMMAFLALLIIFSSYNNITRDAVSSNIHLHKNGMGVQSEYLPVNTKENIDYYETRNKQIVVKDGVASVSLIENNTPNIKADILVQTNQVILELPALYYLGYNIKFTNSNGESKKLEYYENEYGFIEVLLTEMGTLEVSYEGTLANKISRYLALTTIVIIIFLNLWSKRRINL